MNDRVGSQTLLQVVKSSIAIIIEDELHIIDYVRILIGGGFKVVPRYTYFYLAEV